MHTVSIKESFRFGWNTFKRDPWMLVGATAVIGVVSVIVNKLNDPMDPNVLISIVGTVLTWWLFLGLTRMALMAHDGGKPRFDMVFKESWNVLWRYALATIISIIITIVGLILLIVPGIIAQVMLSLMIFLILEKRMMPIEALKESRRMTRGKRWDLFLFFLVAGIFNLIGVLIFGVGLLLTLPVTMLAFAHVYRSIDRGDDMTPVAPTPMPAASAAPTV